MSDAHDRREFLKRLGRAAAYAAPVVATFRPAVGQSPGNSSSMNPNDGGHGDPMMTAAYQGSPGTTNPAPGGAAPWKQPPPSRRSGP